MSERTAFTISRERYEQKVRDRIIGLGNAMETIRQLREALERAEKHVETLHSLVGCANPKGKAVKIVWRDLKLIRAALATEAE